MSSPEKQPLDPLPIDPPDNTRKEDTEPNPDLALTDDANLGLTDPPAINPPDNTQPSPAINPPDNT